MRTICRELGTVQGEWFKIGIQLGIPRYKLQKFTNETDPLSAVVNYWLQGGVTELVVPISWESIVAALKSEYVGEPGLAERIYSKYCSIKDQGQTRA